MFHSVTSPWMSGNETEPPESLTYLSFGGFGHNESREEHDPRQRVDSACWLPIGLE